MDRRDFVKGGLGFVAGLGSLEQGVVTDTRRTAVHTYRVPVLGKGEKQIFVDDVMIATREGLVRKVHQAGKLEKPVLEADMPWEQGSVFNGKRDRRIYLYGTVLKDQESGIFRMWYNRIRTNCYATSKDGIHWDRPVTDQVNKTNCINLDEFHSPSIICDLAEKDPSRRYKAVGSGKRVGYLAAYSADGLHWTRYPKNPILESSDTITLALDPKTSEYLAFHKRGKDPRVAGRQVFLSISKDMQTWSAPEPVMVTDETDHIQARKLEGGTHSEFYNMSAFPYANQWLGVVTHFRRTGTPKVLKGRDWGQSNSEGIIDIQLVHSRDGRKWDRCSDRSPVIPLGPDSYDAGSILGVCNGPVIHQDEMWMYYTAMTTSHGGYLPDKELSIARAAWRTDGLVSIHAGEEEGFMQTTLFRSEGATLIVNADTARGQLLVEAADDRGHILKGYEKQNCIPLRDNSVTQTVGWRDKKRLPHGRLLCLRFFLTSGELFSYTIL